MPSGSYRGMIISLILLDVISVGASLWLLIVVTLWEITSVLVVVWLWLFASLPWAGVGAFAGSAAHISPAVGSVFLRSVRIS